VKARLAVRPGQFRWTSHRFYTLEEPEPKWLTTGVLLELFEARSRVAVVPSFPTNSKS
jgi:hypothetical protein